MLLGSLGTEVFGHIGLIRWSYQICLCFQPGCLWAAPLLHSLCAAPASLLACVTGRSANAIHPLYSLQITCACRLQWNCQFRQAYQLLQEIRKGPMPRRASCLIIGRHPQVPREVKVICKQLTGVLQLGDCCSYLNIATQGSTMTPPDFEAAAGCSKSKNWKVSLA